jgi:hypothetical protein
MYTETKSKLMVLSFLYILMFLCNGLMMMMMMMMMTTHIGSKLVAK